MSPIELKTTERRLRISFWLVALGLTTIIGVSLGARYEGVLLPPVPSLDIERIERSGSSVRLSGHMEKTRDCQLVGLTVYVGDPHDLLAPRERLKFRFLNSSKTDSGARSRPPGAQDWGPLEVSIPQQVRGPSFFIRATHQCHPFFVTNSIVAKRPATDIFGAEYY